MRVIKIIHQDYDGECGMPSHWVVQYIREGAGAVSYYYASDYVDALKFSEANGGINDN